MIVDVIALARMNECAFSIRHSPVLRESVASLKRDVVLYSSRLLWASHYILKKINFVLLCFALSFIIIFCYSAIGFFVLAPRVLQKIIIIDLHWLPYQKDAALLSQTR